MMNLGGRPEARIVAIGARCPLGLNALQVATAARAGKREIRALASLRDRKKQPVGLVRSRFLPEDLFGVERLVALAAPALGEAARSLAAPVPLVLGVAEPDRPDLRPGIEAELLGRIAGTSARVDLGASTAVRAGHASFAFALEAALGLLARGAPAALVGCVDSYVHPQAIAWLDAAYRLHADGTDDGIVPAEGAAFALVVAGDRPDARLFTPPIPQPLATIRHVGAGRDPAAAEPEAPQLATVATELVQRALAACRSAPAWLMTDIDEMHRLEEWSRVETRCQPAFAQVEHQRLPELFGDLGAATGALGAAYACQGWSMGSAPRGTLLVALHADGPPRGVVALEEAAG